MHHLFGLLGQAPVSYTHLDVYKRQVSYHRQSLLSTLFRKKVIRNKPAVFYCTLDVYKRQGEKYVEQFCHRHFIVRTAWLYSYYGKNFVKTIVNAGKKFGKLEVVNDQCGNPTNAVDLAHEILQLCVTHEYGLYHCTGEGVCSWYDFASEIIRLSGVDATVAPCTSEEYKAKHPDSADRPKWSALDNLSLIHI